MKSRYLILVILFAATFFIWQAVFAQTDRGFLRVYFFDVGQGAAVFIEDAKGRQILIDGGPDETILERLGRVLSFYDRTIDLVILTHPDSDHLSGLLAVLKNYEIGQILETGISDSSSEYAFWQKETQEKKIKVNYAHFGQKVKLEGGALEILYPLFSLEDKSFKNTNDTSIVSRLAVGRISFLLTGDAEKKTEWQLVANNIFLDSDVLQVAHHGSKTSTSKEFLEAITPEAAVIQVGAENRYGHPAQEVLERLAAGKIYRTDLDGTIEILTDEVNYKIKTLPD